MGDTDVYRVMFKYKPDDEWQKLYTRNNGYGFYAKLTSAQNAIRQTKSYVAEAKIQKLVAYHPTDSASDLIWEDIDA